MTPRHIFGSVLCVLLLGLFVWLLIAATNAALCVEACEIVDLACRTKARAAFGSPMEMALSTLGGLVSAIVISELAITKPKEVPAARLFAGPNDPALNSKAVQLFAIAYVLVWVITGAAAFVWASLQHTDALKSLSDYGNAWFRLAIASGYSYFGLSRETT